MVLEGSTDITSGATPEASESSAQQDVGSTLGQIEQTSIVSLAAPDPSFLASDSQDSQDSQLSMGTIEFEPDNDNLILSVESISMAQFNCMVDTENTENTDDDSDKNVVKMDTAVTRPLTVDVDTSAVDIEYLSPNAAIPAGETQPEQNKNLSDGTEPIKDKTDAANEKQETENVDEKIAQGKEEKKEKDTGKRGFVPYSDSEDESEEGKTAESPKKDKDKKCAPDNVPENEITAQNGLTSGTGQRHSTEDSSTANKENISVESCTESYASDTSFDLGQTSDQEMHDLNSLDPHCSRTLPMRNLTSRKAKTFSGASSNLSIATGKCVPRVSRMVTIGTQTSLEIDWSLINKSVALQPVLTGSSTSSYSSSGFQTASSNDSLSSASRSGAASSKGGSPARSSPSRPRPGPASSKPSSSADHLSPVAKKSTTKQPISQVAKKSTAPHKPPTAHGSGPTVGQVAKKSTAKPAATISQVAKKSTAKPHSPPKRKRAVSSDTDSGDSDSSSNQSPEKSESHGKPRSSQSKASTTPGTKLTGSVTKRKTSRQTSREASVKKAASIMKKKTRSQSTSGGSEGASSATPRNKRQAARAAARAITVQSINEASPKRPSVARKTSESTGTPGGSSGNTVDSEAEKLKKALETDAGLVIGAGGMIVKRKIVPIKPIQLHPTRSQGSQDPSRSTSSKSHQEGQGGHSTRGRAEGDASGSGNEPISPRRKDKSPHREGKGGSSWDSAWKH